MARLRVQGVDAFAFLQRQCMSDLRLLDVDGAMQWSGLLSAKGRMLFLFRLLRQAEQDFILLASGSSASDLAAELQRFVLRSKLSIEAWPGAVAAALGEAPPATDGWVAWDAQRWVAPMLAAQADAPSLDDHWQHLDTERGVPQIDSALRDRFTPQMLSLQRLKAFSLSKGCYPGQEIVARTHFLGQQKRALYTLRAARALRRGENVLGQTRSLGEVIQVSRLDPQLGLGVLTVDAQDAAPSLEDGSELQCLPAAMQG